MHKSRSARELQPQVLFHHELINDYEEAADTGNVREDGSWNKSECEETLLKLKVRRKVVIGVEHVCRLQFGQR